jgi:hypothetical protein
MPLEIAPDKAIVSDVQLEGGRTGGVDRRRAVLLDETEDAEDPAHAGLTLAAWDRAQWAREAIAKHGAVFTDRFGAPRSRPECAIERDARIAFARLVRELRLDVEPDDPLLPKLDDLARRVDVIPSELVIA